MRTALLAAAAAAVTLVLASPAFGHAIMSPPVAKAKVDQQFTLSVPTEEEGSTTTEIELTVPDGLSIDSFEPAPGWQRTEQASGSGEERVIQKVTWTGGKVPTDEDAVFRFNGSLDSSRTFSVPVRQTYSNGKVVDWTGSESSDTPAPQIEGVSDLGGSSGSTLAIIALVVAALAGIVAVAALVLPASAWAHAALLQTVPLASRTINTAPTEVRLRYSEPVEPRFAIVSVTDAAGRQVTDGNPSTAPGSPQTLVTPLRRVPEGWYLVFWRVISADGHPVRGAFTFAVGPNPGPPPQFRVPSLSETATTTRLLVSRWIVFLSALSALGLFVLRALTARPVARVVRGTSLRALNIAVAV